MEQRRANAIGYLTGRWPLDPTKSTIVFIHGAGGSGAFWSAQVQGLAARANTVAIDLPGHGNSGGVGRTGIEAYAQAVVDFISRLDMPNPIPCGLSMGGAVAQQLLLDHRDQIKAGILISTGARLKVAAVIFETIEKDYRAFVQMVGKMAASAKTDPAVVEEFKNEMARCRSEFTLGDFQACNRFDAGERLASIDAPVLVVSGQDDKLTPPKYADMLEQNIRNACRAHIMAAGHIVPLEKPAEVNRAILGFLDRNGL